MLALSSAYPKAQWLTACDLHWQHLFAEYVMPSSLCSYSSFPSAMILELAADSVVSNWFLFLRNDLFMCHSSGVWAICSPDCLVLWILNWRCGLSFSQENLFVYTPKQLITTTSKLLFQFRVWLNDAINFSNCVNKGYNNRGIWRMVPEAVLNTPLI